MKDTLFFLLLGYALLIMESALGNMASVWSMRVDGIFTLIVWFGVRVPMPEGFTPVLILGVMAEGLTALHPGLYVGSYILAYLMVRYVVNHLMYTSILHKVLLVLFVGMNSTVIILAGSGNVEMVWPWGAAQTMFDGMCAILFFPFFDWLHQLIFSSDRYQNTGTPNEPIRHQVNT